MNDIERKHAGVMQAMVEEFEKHRLPILLKIRDEVEHGKPISEGELEFLEKVIEDAGRTMHLMVNYPELHDFCQHVVHLYQEITAKALENEKNKG
jgi:hypothetical protein